MVIRATLLTSMFQVLDPELREMQKPEQNSSGRFWDCRKLACSAHCEEELSSHSCSSSLLGLRVICIKFLCQIHLNNYIFFISYLLLWKIYIIPPPPTMLNYACFSGGILFFTFFGASLHPIWYFTWNFPYFCSRVNWPVQFRSHTCLLWFCYRLYSSLIEQMGACFLFFHSLEESNCSDSTSLVAIQLLSF